MTDTQEAPPVAAGDEPSDGALDVNAIVAANLRAIRAQRGWTQTEVAERLSRVRGGTLLPQASISAMEVGYMAGRRRRFDADELFHLAEVFDVPVVYFLLPFPDDHLAAERLCRLLGPDERHVDDRLRHLGRRAANGALELMAAMDGGCADQSFCLDDYRRWRRGRIEAMERELWTDLDHLGALLAKLADALRVCGPEDFPRRLEGTPTARRSLGPGERTRSP